MYLYRYITHFTPNDTVVMWFFSILRTVRENKIKRVSKNRIDTEQLYKSQTYLRVPTKMHTFLIRKFSKVNLIRVHYRSICILLYY